MNDYRGNVVAIWILVPLALVKLLQGANVAGFFGARASRRILEQVDKVPVSTFPPAAASHLLFLFAAWGLGIFILGLLGIIVLVRYRSMIPLVFVLLLIEQAGRTTLAAVHLDRPLFSMALTPASMINWAFLLATVLGLLLSLTSGGKMRHGRA